jgi:MFS family permease
MTGAPTVANRALAVGLVMAITANALEAIAVVTAMPAVAESLNGDELYGAAFSAYMLANIVGIVVTSEQADRRGPAGPFLWGVGLFGTGLLVCGLAPTMVVLVLGRVVQGAGGGALNSIVYVAIGRAYARDRQPRMFAIVSAAWVVPALVGPAAAGAITSSVGWRWVFLGLLPVAPALVVLALPQLRRLGAPAEVRLGPSRVPDALVLACGVGLLVGGLALSRPWLGLPLAAVGVAVFVPAARRLLPAGTGRFVAGLPAAVAARLAVNVAFFGADTFIPLAATRLHGASTFVGGLLLTGAAVVWTLGSAYSARVTVQDHRGRVVRAGFLVLAAGIAMTAPVVWTGMPLVATFLTWCLAGFGVGLVFTTTSAAGMAAAPDGHEGLVGSQLGIADALGFALVAAVGGALVGVADRTSLALAGALAIVFAVSFAAALVGAVFATRVGASEPAPVGSVRP